MILTTLKREVITQNDNQVYMILEKYENILKNPIDGLVRILKYSAFDNSNKSDEQFSIEIMNFKFLDSDSFAAILAMCTYRLTLCYMSMGNGQTAEAEYISERAILDYLKLKIDKRSFVNALHWLRNVMNISDNFHDYFIDYLINKKFLVVSKLSDEFVVTPKKESYKRSSSQSRNYYEKEDIYTVSDFMADNGYDERYDSVDDMYNLD